MFFDSYSQRLISGSKTRQWAASPSIFDIFLMFPIFLICSATREVLSRSVTRDPTRVSSFLC